MILKRGGSALLFCKEPQMILDPRLQLAYDLYDRCRVAADIGTDHAYLPIALLRGGKCGRMILTDISPGALQNARTHIREASLGDQALLLEGDGLGVLPEKCEMISLLQLHLPVLEGADPVFGTFCVKHDGNRELQITADLTDHLDAPQMFLMGTVGKVQSCDIHACKT